MPGEGLIAGVVDRNAWPLVCVSLAEPDDVVALAGKLEEILAEEQPFGLIVRDPASLDALHQLLWNAGPARRQLRRLRPRLAAWCEAAVHVLPPAAYARTTPYMLRTAEFVWGCAALAATSEEEASSLLLARLADRPLPLQPV